MSKDKSKYSKKDMNEVLEYISEGNKNKEKFKLLENNIFNQIMYVICFLLLIIDLGLIYESFQRYEYNLTREIIYKDIDKKGYSNDEIYSTYVKGDLINEPYIEYKSKDEEIKFKLNKRLTIIDMALVKDKKSLIKDKKLKVLKDKL